MDKPYYDVESYKAGRSIGYLTRRASKLLGGHMDALFAEHGMNFAQYSVLVNIREKLAVTPSEICQNICHDTGALTRLIDQMEERGLLLRTRSETDRRRIEISLTPKGEEMLDEMIPLVVNFWNGILSDFSTEEADLMTDMLQRFTSALSALPKAKAA